MEPLVWVRSSDVTGLEKRRDSFVVNSTTYYPTRIEPNGLGVTYVTLSKSAYDEDAPYYPPVDLNDGEDLIDLDGDGDPDELYSDLNNE